MMHKLEKHAAIQPVPVRISRVFAQGVNSLME